MGEEATMAKSNSFFKLVINGQMTVTTTNVAVDVEGKTSTETATNVVVFNNITVTLTGNKERTEGKAAQ